jgi:thioredoxin 1
MTVWIITGVLILAVMIYVGYSYKKVKSTPAVETSKKIKILNNKNFKTVIRQNEVVLVDFWAPWCAPCKMIAPSLNDIAESEENITIGKVNVDHNQQLAQKYKIRNIPTLLLFKNGQVEKRITGVKPKKALLKEIKQIA